MFLRVSAPSNLKTFELRTAAVTAPVKCRISIQIGSGPLARPSKKKKGHERTAEEGNEDEETEEQVVHASSPHPFVRDQIIL